MPYWFCPRCQRALGDKEHYPKWYQSPHPQTPGPIVAGHLLNNPNLPIVGVQLNQPNGFYWEYCSKCHTAAEKKNTASDDATDKVKFGFFAFLGILVWIAIIGLVIALIGSLLDIWPKPPGAN
jgi:hypothetical protein